MSTYNEGDLVEAVKGDTVIGGRVSLALDGRVIIGESSRSVGVLENEGFTVTVIERAKPKLPTEPGVYTAHPAAADPLLYQLTPFGSWRVLWHNEAPEIRDAEKMLRSILPDRLVRLVPEAVSA